MAVPELRHVLGAYDVLSDCDVVHDHTPGRPALRRGPRARPPAGGDHGARAAQRGLDRHLPGPGRPGAHHRISEAQHRPAPKIPVARIIHHGIDASLFPVGTGKGDADGPYCLFLGRMSPDKGAHRAIASARDAGMRILMAAKMREPWEVRYFTEQVEPLPDPDAVVPRRGAPRASWSSSRARFGPPLPHPLERAVRPGHARGHGLRDAGAGLPRGRRARGGGRRDDRVPLRGRGGHGRGHRAASRRSTGPTAARRSRATSRPSGWWPTTSRCSRRSWTAADERPPFVGGRVLAVVAGGHSLSVRLARGPGASALHKLTNRRPPPPAVPCPFGTLTCAPEYGIRFCPGGTRRQGPADPELRRRAARRRRGPAGHGQGPFPLIVLLHGLGGSKDDWEVTTDNGGIDDVSLADRGYAVLMYTARGFGDSCGTAAAGPTPRRCARGWIQLADQRYEIRDTQYLAGMLVDEGLVRPDIAVSGVSYGGGQTLELAMLKNRMRLPSGKLVPFTSPDATCPCRWPPSTPCGPGTTWPPPSSPTAALVHRQHAGGRRRHPGRGGQAELGHPPLRGDPAATTTAPPGADPTADLTTW